MILQKGKSHSLLIISWGVILAVLLGASIINSLHNPCADWALYNNAAKKYAEEKPLYDDPIWQNIDKVYFLYSPFFAFLMVPVSLLPFTVSLVLWYLLKLFLLYRVFKIAGSHLGYELLSDKQKALVLMGSFLFSIRFLLYDFNLGQITVVLLWSMLEAWLLISKGKNVTGALLLAFGMFIKLLSVIFIPYLIYKRKFKACIYFILWMLVLAAVPFIFGRWDYQAGLWQSWFSRMNPLSASNVQSNSIVQHSLFDAVPFWYGALAPYLHSWFGFKDPGSSQLKNLTYILVAVFAFGFLFLSRYNRNKNEDSPRAEFAEVAYLLGCIPIIFPLQHKYSYVLMLPLMILVIFKWVTGEAKLLEKILTVAAFLLMVMTTDGIIGHDLNEITQKLKLVTIGGVLLLVTVLFESKVDNRQ